MKGGDKMTEMEVRLIKAFRNLDGKTKAAVEDFLQAILLGSENSVAYPQTAWNMIAADASHALAGNQAD